MPDLTGQINDPLNDTSSDVSRYTDNTIPSSGLKTALTSPQQQTTKEPQRLLPQRPDGNLTGFADSLIAQSQASLVADSKLQSKKDRLFGGEHPDSQQYIDPREQAAHDMFQWNQRSTLSKVGNTLGNIARGGANMAVSVAEAIPEVAVEAPALVANKTFDLVNGIGSMFGGELNHNNQQRQLKEFLDNGDITPEQYNSEMSKVQEKIDYEQAGRDYRLDKDINSLSDLGAYAQALGRDALVNPTNISKNLGYDKATKSVNEALTLNDIKTSRKGKEGTREIGKLANNAALLYDNVMHGADNKLDDLDAGTMLDAFSSPEDFSAILGQVGGSILAAKKFGFTKLMTSDANDQLKSTIEKAEANGEKISSTQMDDIQARAAMWGVADAALDKLLVGGKILTKPMKDKALIAFGKLPASMKAKYKTKMKSKGIYEDDISKAIKNNSTVNKTKAQDLKDLKTSKSYMDATPDVKKSMVKDSGLEPKILDAVKSVGLKGALGLSKATAGGGTAGLKMAGKGLAYTGKKSAVLTGEGLVESAQEGQSDYNAAKIRYQNYMIKNNNNTKAGYGDYVSTMSTGEKANFFNAMGTAFATGASAKVLNPAISPFISNSLTSEEKMKAQDEILDETIKYHESNARDKVKEIQDTFTPEELNLFSTSGSSKDMSKDETKKYKEFKKMYNSIEKITSKIDKINNNKQKTTSSILDQITDKDVINASTKRGKLSNIENSIFNKERAIKDLEEAIVDEKSNDGINNKTIDEQVSSFKQEIKDLHTQRDEILSTAKDNAISDKSKKSKNIKFNQEVAKIEQDKLKALQGKGLKGKLLDKSQIEEHYNQKIKQLAKKHGVTHYDINNLVENTQENTQDATEETNSKDTTTNTDKDTSVNTEAPDASTAESNDKDKVRSSISSILQSNKDPMTELTKFIEENADNPDISEILSEEITKHNNILKEEVASKSKDISEDEAEFNAMSGDTLNSDTLNSDETSDDFNIAWNGSPGSNKSKTKFDYSKKLNAMTDFVSQNKDVEGAREAMSTAITTIKNTLDNKIEQLEQIKELQSQGYFNFAVNYGKDETYYKDDSVIEVIEAEISEATIKVNQAIKDFDSSSQDKSQNYESIKNSSFRRAIKVEGIDKNTYIAGKALSASSNSSTKSSRSTSSNNGGGTIAGGEVTIVKAGAASRDAIANLAMKEAKAITTSTPKKKKGYKTKKTPQQERQYKLNNLVYKLTNPKNSLPDIWKFNQVLIKSLLTEFSKKAQNDFYAELAKDQYSDSVKKKQALNTSDIDLNYGKFTAWLRESSKNRMINSKEDIASYKENLDDGNIDDRIAYLTKQATSESKIQDKIKLLKEINYLMFTSNANKKSKRIETSNDSFNQIVEDMNIDMSSLDGISTGMIKSNLINQRIQALNQEFKSSGLEDEVTWLKDYKTDLIDTKIAIASRISYLQNNDNSKVITKIDDKKSGKYLNMLEARDNPKDPDNKNQKAEWEIGRYDSSDLKKEDINLDIYIAQEEELRDLINQHNNTDDTNDKLNLKSEIQSTLGLMSHIEKNLKEKYLNKVNNKNYDNKSKILDALKSIEKAYSLESQDKKKDIKDKISEITKNMNGETVISLTESEMKSRFATKDRLDSNVSAALEGIVDLTSGVKNDLSKLDEILTKSKSMNISLNKLQRLRDLESIKRKENKPIEEATDEDVAVAISNTPQDDTVLTLDMLSTKKEC